MGMCVSRGLGGVEEVVKVVTTNGGIMELYPPVVAESITNEFPGHGIYRRSDIFSEPLLHNEELILGELYYLLPLSAGRGSRVTREGDIGGHARSKSSMVTPYRMSFDNQGALRRWDSEVLPRYNNSGVWKVKLVISPEKLSEILSQETRTEELIESVRTVAKCGNGVPSAANSDQWSLSSSWKASSERHGLDF